jgi:hypothetical protein
LFLLEAASGFEPLNKGFAERDKAIMPTILDTYRVVAPVKMSISSAICVNSASTQ